MQPVAGMDQLAALLQALQQRQIPPLPAPAPQPVMPQIAAPAQQPDALGLLRLMLTNPQLQQALQGVPGVGGYGYGAPGVQLPVPVPAAPQQLRSVQIPLAAVFSALGSLAARSETGQLAESLDEEPPEYLVGDDGYYIVDPASADDRDALVAHLFRLSDAAQGLGLELDESEEFANAAGFP